MRRPWRTCDLRIHRGLFCGLYAGPQTLEERPLSSEERRERARNGRAPFWLLLFKYTQLRNVSRHRSFFMGLTHRRPASMVEGRRGPFVPFERRFGAVSGSLSIFGHALTLAPPCPDCGRCRP